MRLLNAMLVQYHLIFRAAEDREDFCVRVFTAAVGEDEFNNVLGGSNVDHGAAQTMGHRSSVISLPPDWDLPHQQLGSQTSPPQQHRPLTQHQMDAVNGPLSPGYSGGGGYGFAAMKTPSLDEGRSVYQPRRAPQASNRRASLLTRQSSFFQSGMQSTSPVMPHALPPAAPRVASSEYTTRRRSTMLPTLHSRSHSDENGTHE